MFNLFYIKSVFNEFSFIVTLNLSFDGHKIFKSNLQACHSDDTASRNVSGAKAKGFLKSLEDNSTVMFLAFLLDVLVILSDISEIFQRTEATVSDILHEIELGRENLQKLKAK